MTPTLYGPTGRKLNAWDLYEGGTANPRQRRSSVVGTQYAADLSALVSNYSWSQLLSIGRYLYANSGAFSGAINEIGTYSVGTAYSPIFLGRDAGFGREASAFLDLWFGNCNVRGEPFDLLTCLFLISVALDRDGDIAVLLTFSEDESWPLIQLIPAHRIGNRNHTATVDKGPYRGLRIVNGCITSPVGRVVALNILGDAADGSLDRQISTRDCLWLFEPAWSDQGRGIPPVGASCKDWQDAREIIALERTAIRAGSSIALLEFNEAGSADPAGGQFNADADGTGLHTETLDEGAIRYFRSNTGADLRAFEQKRPAAEVQGFLKNTILRSAFGGLGWPIEMAFDPAGLTGPAVRLVLGKAERKVQDRQRILWKTWFRLVTYALAKGMKEGYLGRHSEWLAWDCTLPKTISIDLGRQSASDLAALKSGQTTLADLCGQNSTNWRGVLRQKAAEAAEVKALAAEFGVDPSQIQDLGADPLPGTPTATPTTTPE